MNEIGFSNMAPAISRLISASAKMELEQAPSDESLPTISFVVTNYNYGEYLTRVLGSIFNQRYPKIECVIVDDASTDASVDIIRKISAPAHVNLITVFNPKNIGQACSCVEGFRRTTGEFVAFIDADDELYPDYAAAHIGAHLTIRKPVGFSSCDLAIFVDERMVVGTIFEGPDSGKSTEPITPSGVLATSAGIAPFFSDLPHYGLRYVKRDTLSWPWSPTSGNVYRRDALSLFVGNESLKSLRYSADAYFNFAINSLCSSVLIDKAFGIYHVHRRNYFAQSALLFGIRCFDVRRDAGSDAAYLALKHIVENFELFADKVSSIVDLNRAMRTLARKAAQSTSLSKYAFSILVKVLAAKWRFELRGLTSRHSSNKAFEFADRR
jgi:glycosyltransferase involved in cell wall biosynthesis